MKKILFALLFLFALRAEATERWVLPAGSGSTCSDASPCSLATGIAATQGGDTLWFKAGTYTSAGTTFSNTIPSGISASQPTLLAGVPGVTAIIAPSSAGTARAVQMNTVRTNITFRNLVFDGTNVAGLTSGILFNDVLAHQNLIVEDSIIRNWKGTGIEVGNGASNITIRRNDILNSTGVSNNSNGGHCIYLRAGNSLVEQNRCENTWATGITLRTDTSANFNIIRFNRFKGNSTNQTITNGGRAINISGNDNLVLGNFIIGSEEKGLVVTKGNIFRNKIYSNTFYNNSGNGIENQAGSTNEIKNNISINNGGTQIIAGAATVATNLTTGTVADIFNNAANDDLCLKSTATTAINQGTAQSGFFFNGTAPDIGACETVDTAAITAVSTDSSVDLAFPINIAAALPLLPSSGITGFTLSDTRTVTSATLFAEGIIRLFYTGTCTGGTVSYSPGNVTDSILIGNSINQPLFAFSGKVVTNDCGGGTPTPPPGLHIDYALDDGSGTNADDATANELDGTLTDGPTWVSGHTGSAVYFAPSVQDYIAVPYGNAVNPSTQSLTIAFGVLPDANATAGNYTVFAAPGGTNQHLRIRSTEGTWTQQIQGSTLAVNTEFPVTAAWTRLCVVLDSDADTATLHVNGVAGTSAESIKAYTSYALAGNFDIGRISGTTNVLGFAVDDFKLWPSVESCADDFAAWSPPAPVPGGSFTQVAYQLYLARTDSAGNLLKLPLPGAALNAPAVTPAGGVVAMEIQANCDNVANCDPLGMVLQRAPLLVDTWSDVPDSDIGAASFYGTSDSGSEIPSGVPTCPLSGALTCVDGGTIRTASAVPVIDLGQNESTVNRYIVKVNESSRFRLRNQDGNIFGTYSQYPTITVVGDYAGAGF